jgi:endonuclease YncB( thermonuclease family)
MKDYRFLICLWFCAFVVIPPVITCAQETMKVSRVSDGDSVVLIDGRRVRYIGINAPEIGHESKKAELFGHEAKAYNNALVASKTIRLQFGKERYDRFGRLLAYAFLSDGTFINKAMIERGYAYFLPRKPNIKYNTVLLYTQRDAMSAKRGMWRELIEEEGGYWGNRRSLRFHDRTCPFGKKIGPANRVFFKSKWDAFWAGFAPGKKCMAGKVITKTRNTKNAK